MTNKFKKKMLKKRRAAVFFILFYFLFFLVIVSQRLNASAGWNPSCVQVPALHPPLQPHLYLLCLHPSQWTATRRYQRHQAASQQPKRCTPTAFTPIKVQPHRPSAIKQIPVITLIKFIKYSRISTNIPLYHASVTGWLRANKVNVMTAFY